MAFATQQEYQPYARSHDVLAFLDTRAGKERIVLGPVEDYLQAFRVSHELAHYVLFSRFPLQPRWFAEGMAEFAASGAGPPGRSYATGLPFPWNLRLVNASRTPVRELLAWRTDESYGPSYYPSSWLLVDYLANRYPDELRDFETRLANFEDPADAWNAAFPAWSLTGPGRTVVLDDELDAYKRSLDERPRLFPVTAPASVSERPLSPAEAIMTLASLERRWAPGELESELDHALALDPTNVQALTMKAERDPAKAAKLAESAVRAHPEDAAAWLLRARWPGSIGREARKRRETYLRKALELAPDDPDIALDCAALFLEIGSPQAAMRLVLQAQRAAAWNPFAFWLGAVAHASVRQCDEADTDALRLARLLAVGGAEPPADLRMDLDERLRVCRAARAREMDGAPHGDRRKAR